jgi:hypothetical protein
MIALISWNCSSEEPNPSTTVEAKAIQVKQEKLPDFQTIIAQPATQQTSLNVTGRVQALEKLQIVAEVQGKALTTKKLLNEGIRYRKGETMIKVDDQQYRLNLQAQKSQFQSALVRIMSAIKLDYPEAHPAWDQYLKNFDATQSLPNLPTVNNEQLNYFLSANNVFSTYYSIKSAEKMLPKYTISAPFTGVITQGNLSAGAIVSPGVPLASYSRTDVYELKAAISSAQIQRFKVGQKIQLTHNNTKERFTGTINRIGASIDPSTQAVPVFIRLSGASLKEGMFLEADVDLDVQENIVVLPLKALNRSNQVHIIEDSVVILKEVTPVSYQGSNVWITGLEGGEQVIIEEIIEPIVGSKAVPKI